MEQTLLYVILGWLVLSNLVALILMKWDKYCAQKGKRRIPEKTLFLWAIIGGSLGANLGMQWFRHKTKHTQFVVGMPLIFIAQLALAIWILFF